MKFNGKILIAFLLALLTVVILTPVEAQVTFTSAAGAASRTYDNDQNDTIPLRPSGTSTLPGYRIAAANFISVRFAFNDSVEATIYTQYRKFGSTSWATIYTDSTTGVLTGSSSAPTIFESVIRNHVLDKFTYGYGISGYIRYVIVFGPTKNGRAGTNTYSSWVDYKQ